MNIAYYMPFKPLGHPNPSGDLITGTELFNHLAAGDNDIFLASQLRCRWIYYRPDLLVRLAMARHKIINSNTKPNLWLTYHSYYKAPDMLGRYCSARLNIPYVIFQGIFSTKRKTQLKTLPGYLLNKKALMAADLVFTNKRKDLSNLKRLLPADHIEYIAPGIQPKSFTFSDKSRADLRQAWAPKGEAVIMSAAMMRPGVKAEGIRKVIGCCADLTSSGEKIRLVIAGDGECRSRLEQEANQLLPGRVIFLGKIPRQQLYRYYSAADIFAFPGIDESLGMVYLEAQACGLPVVAYQDWGGGEAVVDQKTGLLAQFSRPGDFQENIKRLLHNTRLRAQLGKTAAQHIRKNHDIHLNYAKVEDRLTTLASLANKR